jgi:hypothetical protein
MCWFHAVYDFGCRPTFVALALWLCSLAVSSGASLPLLGTVPDLDGVDELAQGVHLHAHSHGVMGREDYLASAHMHGSRKIHGANH